MTSTVRGLTLCANLFDAPARGRIDSRRVALIEVDGTGTITAVTAAHTPHYAGRRNAAVRAGRLVTLPPRSWLLPGFVDLHVHAPQYPQLGAALDMPLQDWLHRYTFPLEARYADLAFARRCYATLVTDLLARGTTTAVYFATIHQAATRLLVDLCLAAGQRALIGKVAMDDPAQCPDNYRDASAEVALHGTRDLIDYIRAHPANRDARVRPAITPRFIPACTDRLLAELGVLARNSGCHVQTHCAESDWEDAFVRARHGTSDAASLDRFGLLGRHSVLAHATFITPDDMDRIGARAAGIAHCPLSNAWFAGAVFPLRAALVRGLNVGLGTDISAGPSSSMFDACRFALAAARMLESGTDPALPPAARSVRSGARIDVRDAFYLATAGGGVALDLPIGRIAPGYLFDAMLIDADAPGGALRILADLDTDETILSKIILTANDHNIARVWVGGEAVT